MLSWWRRNRFSASSRRGDLKKSMTNIVSECRSANIVRDHAMILPDDATPKPDGIFGKDRVKLDPLLVQLLGLVRRGLAVDRATLDLTVVHLARLFGKSPPNIIGVPGEMFAQFLQLLAELMLLRRYHGDRRGSIRLRRLRGLFGC